MTTAQPALVAASAAQPGDAAPGSARRPRRRFFTGDARRPWMVCRFPRPVNGEHSEPAYCRCGGALDRTAASRTGWRHRPTRRRAPIGLEPVR